MSATEVLFLNSGLIAVAMVLLWLVSLRLRDASIVDIFWGIGFVLIAWATFVATFQATFPNTATDLRSILLVAMTTLWGLRLAAYLAWRNHGRGEDSRYAAMREHRGKSFGWVSFFTVFALQGVVMLFVALPVQIGQTETLPLSMANYAGIAMWLVGFGFEAIGDYQLAKFKSDGRNQGRVMDQGLWRYTRHPNYFGNAMIWWGITMVAVTMSTWWLVVSPIFMTFLLLKVSGVALLERDLSNRSSEYRDYMNRTSPFLPWPPNGVSEPTQRN